MCSAHDDPSMYDNVPSHTNITRPRTYVLAGSEPPKPSAALAILGDMLNDAENDLRVIENSNTGPTTIAMARVVVDALRRARNRVSDAEARR
jgi:hypothetical protein